MKEALIEIVKKVELQSILVLLITLVIGMILLYLDNSFTTPAGILGSISIACGLLYTMASFYSNQLKESYADVISHYQNTIKSLTSGHEALHDADFKRIGETYTVPNKDAIVRGGYVTDDRESPDLTKVS